METSSLFSWKLSGATKELTEFLSFLRLNKRPCKFVKDDYICIALIMHLVITIVIVVDWRMNLLNEVEVYYTIVRRYFLAHPL